MRRKTHGKVLAAILLAASIMTVFCACGDKKQQPDSHNEQPESGTAGSDTDHTAGEDSGKEETEEGGYSVTEENANPELSMNRQPEASYWFPAQLLEWNAKDDEDLIFNVSHVPLAERAALDELETVNDTQNKDTKVMAV